MEALLHASIRGAVVAGVVRGVCRLLPVLPPATRAWLWWCTSASFLVGLCWTTLMLERTCLRFRRTRLLVATIVVLIAVVVVPWRLVARHPSPASADVALAPVPVSATVAQAETLAATIPDVTEVPVPTSVERPGAVQSQATSPALQPCVTTTPVHARAPDDPNASPVTGWWHMSADKALWVPSAPPGESTIGLGRYWVRPAGQPLTVRGRRLDGDAPPVLMVEPGDARYGFFFGGPSTPTEGCWEFEATSGASRVTFITEIHHGFEVFAQRPESRVTWSQQVGRIESDSARAVVTAIVVEDPATRTKRLGGARIDLSDGSRAVTLFESVERLEGTRAALESMASGLAWGPYGLGRSFNINSRGTSELVIVGREMVASGTASFSVVGEERTFSFPGRTPADMGRLLVAAGDALRTRLP